MSYYHQLYDQQCVYFEQNDRVLWSSNQRIGAEQAQVLFGKDWNLLSITSNWKETATILPPQYLYELYSSLLVTRVLAIIFVICMTMILLCCCQVFCTPKYKVFMRCCYINVETDTKSMTEKYSLFFGIIVFGLLLCVICGLSYTDQQIENSLLQVKCITLWMLKTSIHQQVGQGWQPDWKGVETIKQQIDQLNQTITSAHVQKSLQGLQKIEHQKLQESYLASSAALRTIYKENKKKTLHNPNPQNLTRIVPEYIANLGPIEQIGTVTQQLYDELSSRQRIILLQRAIQNKSETIAANMSKVENKLGVCKEKLKSFIHKVIKFLTQMQDNINQHNWILDSGISAYKKFLEMIGFTVVLLFLSFILVTWCRFYKIAFLLHLSWICSSVLLLFGIFILSFVFYASIIDTNIVCPIANGIASDQQILERIISLQRHQKHLYQNSTFLKQLSICMYKKGNFIQYFELKEDFETISKLQEYTETIQQIELSQNVLIEQVAVMSEYLTDYGLAMADIQKDNAYDMLTLLNQLTDYSLKDSLQLIFGQCRVSRDQWKWKKQFCTNYYATSVEQSQLGMAICLLFDDYDYAKAKARYEEQYGKCKKINKEDISAYILRYFESLRSYSQSVNDTFMPISQSFRSYQNNQSELDTGLLSNIQNITYFSSQLKDLYAITSQLEISMDCSYIQDGASRIRNTFCITVLNGLFLMYLYLTMICAFLGVLTILSVWSAMRCIPKPDQHLVFQQASDEAVKEQDVGRRTLDVD